MEEPIFASRRRAYILGSIFVIMIGILLYRLFELQFVQFDEFRFQAERNSVRKLSREPARGLIYDKDLNIIVDNNPSYTLTITPYEFDRSNMPQLCTMFELDSNIVNARILRSSELSFEPVKIERDIPFAYVSLLEENRNVLPGVSYLIETRRVYHMKPRMAHLLGYTKEISSKKLGSLGDYYRPGDIVGYNGVESYHEPTLRGNKGYGFFTVDSRGRVIESFDHGQSDIPALEGSDLVLSVDLDLQLYAERILRNRLGSIVALDPNNGEVLAMVSSPDYDLRAISGRISYKDWNSIITVPGYPMYNRSTMAAYPPGSTFKMMLAAAALQEGTIDERTIINCPGSYTLAGVPFKCHGAHGNVTVRYAIEQSCNVFFYKLIYKLGFDLWSKYGAMFHFGKLTGIDIRNETAGTLPSEEYYNNRYGNNWNLGYLVNLGIGQGEVNTTPLQMAAYTATIANKGTYYQPHVVRSVIDRLTGKTEPVQVDKERLPISTEVWDIVRQGMYRVVNGNGTGYSARLSGIKVAGKTGTAQNPHGEDHAWFVAFAPYEKPKIAVAVILENAGAGGTAAAPVAGSVINYFFRRGYVPKARSDSSVATSASQQLTSTENIQP
jgi:penicillin-binding protein 2